MCYINYSYESYADEIIFCINGIKQEIAILLIVVSITMDLFLNRMEDRGRNSIKEFCLCNPGGKAKTCTTCKKPVYRNEFLISGYMAVAIIATVSLSLGWFHGLIGTMSSAWLLFIPMMTTTRVWFTAGVGSVKRAIQREHPNSKFYARMLDDYRTQKDSFRSYYTGKVVPESPSVVPFLNGLLLRAGLLFLGVFLHALPFFLIMGVIWIDIFNDSQILLEYITWDIAAWPWNIRKRTSGEAPEISEERKKMWLIDCRLADPKISLAECRTLRSELMFRQRIIDLMSPNTEPPATPCEPVESELDKTPPVKNTTTASACGCNIIL